MNRRRAVLLLLVLVSLALTAALVTPLATLSGLAVLETADRAAALRHRLAANSLVAVLPRLMAAEAGLRRDLDRANRALVAFDLADLHVVALIQDDTAKLPLPLVAGQSEARRLAAALTHLQAELVLPPLALAASGPTEARWTGCPEDLFGAPTDGALYGTPQTGAAWMHYLAPLGEVVHAHRAAPAVLEAALRDVRPGLGTHIACRRAAQTRPDLNELLEGVELTAGQRREAQRRLTLATQRYSLIVRTDLGGDVRQRYVVCTAGVAPSVLLDWEVAP